MVLSCLVEFSSLDFSIKIRFLGWILHIRLDFALKIGFFLDSLIKNRFLVGFLIGLSYQNLIFSL